MTNQITYCVGLDSVAHAQNRRKAEPPTAVPDSVLIASVCLFFRQLCTSLNWGTKSCGKLKMYGKVLHNYYE